MLKLRLLFVRVILGLIHLLSKLMLNLVLLWLKISWMIIEMGMLFTSVVKLLILFNQMLKIHRPVVGMPVISVKIGDHCYHGLCDMGASASAIPHSLYKEIMHDIAPAEIEEIDVTIKLANRYTISPIGIVRDVEVLCGKTKYPADFLVLGSPQDSFCPIIFGRPFLNTVNATIQRMLLLLAWMIWFMSLISLNLVNNIVRKNCLVSMKLLVLLLLLYLLVIL